VDIALMAYITVVVETNFDTGAGLDVGVVVLYGFIFPLF
jgi:hypothetical protein